MADWPGGSEEGQFFSLERASLEQVLNVKTSVATRSAMNIRETPGLVTVITREEIQTSGARDLVDVLSMVPDFDFGVDVQGNLGLGVRGQWGNEGKVLLLWDGQPFNETLYSTIQFDRFPVDQIERVEIIRGPGSVLYGGNAELAVINVLTRSPAELDGSSAYAGYGQGETAMARGYAGYSYGKALPDGTELSAKAFWEQAQRSDRAYADFSGASASLNGSSDIKPTDLNLYAARNDASLRLVYDDLTMGSRDDIDGSVISTGPAEISFPALSAELRKSFYLPHLVRLEPYVRYAWSKPWLEKDQYFPYNKTARRATAGLTAYYQPSPYSELLAGGEYFRDSVSVDDAQTGPSSQYPGGRTSAAYDNYAVYAQAALDLVPANIIAGARYDVNSQYGSALSPRLAVTKLVNDFNFKAIYSQAFRAPSIENIRLNPDIKPEKEYSGEFEAGYKFSKTFFLSADAFRTDINDPIVYSYTGSSETYMNYGRTGTQGFGATAKYKNGLFRADLGYLFYAARGNKVDSYAVPGHGSYLLGFPKHKITLNASFPLSSRLRLTPSAVYISKRYGYSGSGAVRAFGERTIASLALCLRGWPAERARLTLSVHDLFKSGYSYIQPYDGGHAPLPAPSRELFLKGEYDF